MYEEYAYATAIMIKYIYKKKIYIKKIFRPIYHFTKTSKFKYILFVEDYLRNNKEIYQENLCLFFIKIYKVSY